ncbi:hypothetical protein [Streptomyces bohaiensis]|uniref:Sensor domain-containing protein n=1 Tax=Streptomyces bohaiensis TaxID=1431344 RepID=A0ABX1C725_9ACTN|nr:hypothetical protein [Streptomyces bohaiensis]NJQ13863.1 hypothetical protein [Streptomyces bohaiensis]
MRWQLRVVMGAVGAAMLLPGAGASASAESLDEEQLRSALLDHMDFPEDWARDSEQAEAQRGIGVPAPQEANCRALFDGGADTAASTAFARSFSGPFVRTTAAAHDGEGAAEAALENYRRTAEACNSFAVVEGEGHGPTELRVVYNGGGTEEPSLDDSAADEVAAVRFEREPESTEAPAVVAEAALVRVGEHTVLVAQVGRDDAGTGELRPMLDRAVEKLYAVQEGRTPEPPTDLDGTEL